MARPAKPAKVIRMEGVAHRTNRELALREREEKALLSGTKLKESQSVKEDIIAHKEFLRVRALLEAIDKDDDLYSGSINTYCELASEIERLAGDAAKQREEIEGLKEREVDFEDIKEFYALLTKMEQRLDFLDRKIDQKRKLRLTIERENSMTVASALRSIPKKPQSATSDLKRALYGS